MTSEAQTTTLRNAGMLVLQRAAQVAGGLIFALLVPRLMGPKVYGQYALVTSLSVWFVLLSGLGLTQVMGRHVPEMASQPGRLRPFFERLLAAEMGSGALAAGLYLLLMLLWLGDLDPVALGLVGVALFVRTVSHVFFSLFLGLNQAARWGAEQVVRDWVLPLSLLPGYLLAGLRGACGALLLTEFVILVLGVRWAWPAIRLPRPRLDLRPLGPYLRFGLLFFASNLILAAFRRSGEAMVQVVTGDYAEVGYFSLAYDVYGRVALALPQLTLAFTPLLLSLREHGDWVAIGQWIERLLKVLGAGGVVAFFAALLMGEDLVPLILGPEYRPVARNLVLLVPTLQALALSESARLLTLVYDRPGVALATAGVKLVAFWGIGPWLVARWGSLGGCLAVLTASAIYAACFTWQSSRVVGYSLRTWVLAVLLGIPFLPLFWLRSTWEVNVALFGVFLIGYLALLALLRVLSLHELRAAWRVMDRKAYAR